METLIIIGLILMVMDAVFLDGMVVINKIKALLGR